MSRRNFRKTARKQSKPVARLVTREFTLPLRLGFATRPGRHGWGVEVLPGDRMRVTGRSMRNVRDLAGSFLNRIGGSMDEVTVDSAAHRKQRKKRRKAPTRRSVPDEVEVVEEELPSFGIGDPGDETG